MIIIENKDVINTKIIKCSLIRYYMIRKNNEVFKANFDFKIIKSRSKDILNSFYLPDDITISEPFAQAEDNALSLDQLPEWIAEKITKAEETGVDDPYMMFSVYQCIWNGDLYYFIYSPLKSCIYCDSVFYPDGQVIEWEDSEQIHAFVEESIDWKLIYGLDRGKKQ